MDVSPKVKTLPSPTAGVVKVRTLGDSKCYQGESFRSDGCLQRLLSQCGRSLFGNPVPHVIMLSHGLVRAWHSTWGLDKDAPI